MIDTKVMTIEAVILHHRSKAQEALVKVQTMLSNPSTDDMEGYVDRIAEYTEAIANHENAIQALQMYFVPKPAPEPAPQPAPEPSNFERALKAATSSPDPVGQADPLAPTPANQEPITHDDLVNRSSTYRNSVKERFDESE